MRAGLDDIAVRDDEDAAGRADGGQAVGDDECRAVFCQLVERVLDFGLGQRIKRARRLVENQDRWIFEEDTRNRNALLLSAGKKRSALADVGVEAVWHGQNVVVNLRALRGLHDFIHRRVGLSVADVLQNRVGKQEHLLLHNADIPAQALLREAANIQPVKKDFAGRNVIKARDELAERRLAAARAIKNAMNRYLAVVAPDSLKIKKVIGGAAISAMTANLISGRKSDLSVLTLLLMVWFIRRKNNLL